MADFHRHHHQHRPHRLSVPPRTTTTPKPYFPGPNLNPTFRYSSTTPTPTPSKHCLSSSFSFNSKSKSKSTSLSFLFLLLFSLRSLYSLFPFLRSSSPSFSLFPFTFLVSLLSFFLTLFFSLFSSSFPSSSSSSSSKDPFHQHKPKQPLFNFSHSQQRVLVAKSILLALVFLLRFQALLYCGTAAMIIAELMGTVTARRFLRTRRNGWIEIRGFVSLFLGLFMLSIGWDRIECFPLSKNGENCVRVWQLLLPFMSGFLACYEQGLSMDLGTFKQLDHKRVRLITLFFTTIVLFVPAVVSFFVFESDEDGVSFGNLAWPLANTVVFGVLLSENYCGGGNGGVDLVSFKDSKREFLVTFGCTLILQLFYYPDISLWGLLLCGLLLYVAVRDLDPFDSHDLGLGDESSQLLNDMVMKPIRHILSERKSRKIALFLLINAGYMVVEFVAGFMSNSLGLISDACHMLFDCAALAIGLYASYISRLPANNHYNYGRGRFEVLSGYTNAVFLVLVGALIVVESFERILDPQEISTNSLLVVSVGGLVVNVIGLIFFHEEHHHAHGLSGSCSHSHSHSHSESHSHSPHHHHETHGSNQEFISVSSDCQDNSCSGDPGHHNHSSHERKVESHQGIDSIQSFKSHGHARQHDHHEPATQFHDHHHHIGHHDHSSHERKAECIADNHSIQSFKHHDYVQQHDHHDPIHRHDHHHNHTSHHDHGDCHDHNHNHQHHDNHSIQSFKHHDHAWQHDHHDPIHCQDHHNHASDHDHGDCHDHNHHDHQHQGHHHLDADHHSHDAPLVHQKHGHRHIDHNMEGIFLHVLADTLGSVGVVISTLLIKYKGWLVADPACSIFISVLIISSVIPLLRNSAEILLQRAPRAHEHELKDSLTNVLKIRGVYGIQKFHSWSFTNTDVVGTLHLHVSTDTDKVSVKSQVSHLLHEAGIKDLTLQVECVG